MKVMMPNAPTPYSVTRLYPVISDVFSAPGTGRRAQEQSLEPIQGETIAKIFAQERRQVNNSPVDQTPVQSQSYTFQEELEPSHTQDISPRSRTQGTT
jgi:hypothetical protein